MCKADTGGKDPNNDTWRKRQECFAGRPPLQYLHVRPCTGRVKCDRSQHSSARHLVTQCPVSRGAAEPRHKSPASRQYWAEPDNYIQLACGLELDTNLREV